VQRMPWKTFNAVPMAGELFPHRNLKNRVV
jgi:hypothetical protein